MGRIVILLYQAVPFASSYPGRTNIRLQRQRWFWQDALANPRDCRPGACIPHERSEIGFTQMLGGFGNHSTASSESLSLPRRENHLRHRSSGALVSLTEAHFFELVMPSTTDSKMHRPFFQWGDL